MANVSESQHPMARICKEWLAKIEIAKKAKWDVFGQYAEESSRFYDGPHDWMWAMEYATGSRGFLSKEGSHLPMFRMTVNKPFEAVALFGPALMHKYPNVLVTPSIPPIIPPEGLGIDVNDQTSAQQYQMYLQSEDLSKNQRTTHAALAQHYLNWLQIETNKKISARRAITEAIVKGLGLFFTEMHQPVGSQIRYPRSRFVSCDSVQKDPDAEYAEDVTWYAMECIHPINRVAAAYGLPEEELRGHMQSFESQGTSRGKKDAMAHRQPGSTTTYDLLRYWKLFSKNGFGHRLKSVVKTTKKSDFDFDQFGDFCFLAIAKDIPYPLNVHSSALAEDFESLLERVSWPIPFWTDEGAGNGWPFSELHFYEKMNCVWPLSLIKTAIGEIRFVNWCMSFLADKTAANAKTYVAVAKAAGKDLQEQLLNSTGPYTVLEISDLLGKNIADVVSFLQAPNFSIDIWKMVSEVMQLIDKRTGLTELIYGMTSVQLRSAAESQIKSQNVSIRPDDMAERTEDFYSQSALKEMEAAVWSCTGQDVAGVLGNVGAMIFEQQMQTVDFESVVRDYKYRIESGSARKPNKANRQSALTEFGQVALPVIQQFALAGMTGPWNAYMSEIAKAMDFDASPFLVQEQQMPGQDQGEAQAAEADEERKEEEHQSKMQMEQDKMDMAEEKHKLGLKMMGEKAAMAKKAAAAKPKARKSA